MQGNNTSIVLSIIKYEPTQAYDLNESFPRNRIWFYCWHISFQACSWPRWCVMKLGETASRKLGKIGFWVRSGCSYQFAGSIVPDFISETVIRVLSCVGQLKFTSCISEMNCTVCFKLDYISIREMILFIFSSRCIGCSFAIEWFASLTIVASNDINEETIHSLNHQVNKRSD